MKRLMLFLIVLVSGCATTEQVLLATDDQVEVSGSDIFLSFQYAYINNSEIIVCTDVLRTQKNLFDNKHHFDNFSYEFSLPIETLEEIKHSKEKLYFVRERYVIKREDINECKQHGQPSNTKPITITKINNSDYSIPHEITTGSSRTNVEKIALRGESGDLLYTSSRQLLYVTQKHNLLKIKTEPPITEGSIGFYLLVPFTAIYDVIAFPFRLLSFSSYQPH